MTEGSRGLREIAPNQSQPLQLREFTVSTGAAFSTLQDIKLPDSAGQMAYIDPGVGFIDSMSGGYTYNNDGDSSILDNRTLYWRTRPRPVSRQPGSVSTS